MSNYNFSAHAANCQPVSGMGEELERTGDELTADYAKTLLLEEGLGHARTSISRRGLSHSARMRESLMPSTRINSGIISSGLPCQ